MWLNVIWAKLALMQCCPAVFSAILGWPDAFSEGTSWLVFAVACLQLFTKCILLEPCLDCHFCAVFFPSSPSSFSFGPVKYLVGEYSTEQFSVTVPCGRRSKGYHGYLLPCATALPGSTNFVGTSAQAHILVMSLIFLPCFLHVTFCLVYSCWWFCWSPAQHLKDDKSSL